jgi:hypothetical protein
MPIRCRVMSHSLIRGKPRCGGCLSVEKNVRMRRHRKLRVSLLGVFMAPCLAGFGWTAYQLYRTGPNTGLGMQKRRAPAQAGERSL